MKISKRLENKTLFLDIEGRLDTLTAPELEKEIASIGDISELIIDMKNLEYISSAGLRVILKIQKLMNGKGLMILKNVRENVMEIFEITGFSDFLKIE